MQINVVRRAINSELFEVSVIFTDRNGIQEAEVADREGVIIGRMEEEESAACPNNYVIYIEALEIDKFPIYASGANCREERTDPILFEERDLIPVEDGSGSGEGCLPPSGPSIFSDPAEYNFWESCRESQDELLSLREEIENDCERIEELSGEEEDHRNNATIGAIVGGVLTLAGIVLCIFSLCKPWGIACFFAAAAAFGYAIRERQEADRIQGQIRDLRVGIRDAQDRWEVLLNEAIRKCCGVLSTSTDTSLPSC